MQMFTALHNLTLTFTPVGEVGKFLGGQHPTLGSRELHIYADVPLLCLPSLIFLPGKIPVMTYVTDHKRFSHSFGHRRWTSRDRVGYTGFQLVLA